MEKLPIPRLTIALFAKFSASPLLQYIQSCLYRCNKFLFCKTPIIEQIPKGIPEYHSTDQKTKLDTKLFA